MLKLVSFLVLFFCTSEVASLATDGHVEYLGIKSGMTKAEVTSFLDLNSVAQAENSRLSALYSDKSVNEVAAQLLEEGVYTRQTKVLSGKDLQLRLYFTDKGLLWRLDIYIGKPDDPAKRIGLDKAVIARFKGHSINEESSPTRYGTDEYYRVVMTDNAVLSEVVERYMSEFLSKM